MFDFIPWQFWVFLILVVCGSLSLVGDVFKSANGRQAAGTLLTWWLRSRRN